MEDEKKVLFRNIILLWWGAGILASGFIFGFEVAFITFIISFILYSFRFLVELIENRIPVSDILVD